MDHEWSGVVEEEGKLALSSLLSLPLSARLTASLFETRFKR